MHDQGEEKIRRETISAYGQSLPSILLILLIVIFPLCIQDIFH